MAHKSNIHLNPKNMKNVIEITVLQLLVLIESLRPSMFVSITQVTDARLRIKSAKNDGIVNPKEAVKISSLNTHSGIDYTNKVKAVTEDENFVARESSYNLISNNKMLAQNKKSGQKYFVYSGFQNTNARTKFLVDAKIVSKFNLSTDTLPKVYPSTTTVVWRTVKVENVRRMTVNGQRYKVLS
jgi:hypothetical protein